MSGETVLLVCSSCHGNRVEVVSESRGSFGERKIILRRCPKCDGAGAVVA